jgi:hypothetical protein
MPSLPDMRKHYTSPAVEAYGSVAALTGLFGSQQIQDVLVNPQGQVVLTGQGSIDACPTQNPVPGATCLIRS